jgi:glycosyltransferase involved in cell wall biosynthesis
MPSATLPTPDVSVIIPTFNRLWSLPHAVESCRGTVCSTEIIVVDDGSTDRTWAWLQTQGDVVAIRQSNLGKPWAVNKGYAAARGEFIRFLDSDDWYLDGAIDAQLNAARGDNADVVVGGYSTHSDPQNLLREQPWSPCDDFIAQQLGECDSSHYSAYLFRRAFLKDILHRPEAEYRDDRVFVLEVALKHPVVSIYNGLALAHRHHGGGRLQFPTGLRAAATNYQHLEIYRRVLRELECAGELNQRRKTAATKVLWPLAHWIAYTHPEEGAEVADWIYELNPDFVPPETGLLGEMYRRLGFSLTERILRMRRTIKSVLS